MSKFDFTSSLYARVYDRAELLHAVEDAMGGGDTSVRLVPLYAKEPPPTLFRRVSGKNRRISLVSSSTEVSLFELTYSQKQGQTQQQRSERFFIFPHQTYPGVWVLLTIGPGDFLQRAVLPVLRGMYPEVIQTFISHKRLRRLLDRFLADNGFSQLRITRASQKLRREDDARRIIPVVSWPDMNVDEAFQWVAQNNGWFNKIEFEPYRDSRSVANISLTRQGVIRSDALLSIVVRDFVDPIAKTIHENIEFFSQRGRRDNPNLAVRPLSIDFGSEQFADVAENSRLIRSLRRLPSSSVSVLHGNPYLHASVIDYLDGSTFDVWVLRSTELVIVPQLKASFPAIKRLINHIFDIYAEGEIREFVEGTP